MGAAFGFTAPVGADHTRVTAVSGSAFGVDAEGLVQIDREPLVVLPANGTDGDPITDRTARVDVSPLVTVDLLEVSTRGDTGKQGFSESEARATDVLLLGDPIDAATDGALSDLLDDLLGGGDGGDGEGGLLGGNLLGGGGSGDGGGGDDGLLGDLLGDGGLLIEAIESECRADAEGVEGSTTVVGLTDQGDPEDGEIIELEDEELEIDLGVLRIVFNEQEETNEDGFREITVNGARITVLGDGDDIDEADDDALLDVILAQSKCDVEFEEVEKTTTTNKKTTTTEKKTTTTEKKDKDRPAPVVPGNNEATNDGSASNESDGEANIDTGDATAIGNVSNTEIDQSANAAGGSGGRRGGSADVDQDASVTNEGEADANTGDNTAIGNASDNEARNRQESVATDTDDTNGANAAAAAGAACNNDCDDDDDDDGSGGDNTATNTGTASNTSDGTADITTGDATAVGNISNTEINQTANAAGGSGGGDDADSDDDECRGDDAEAEAAEVEATGGKCDKCEKPEPKPCDDDCDKDKDKDKPCDDDCDKDRPCDDDDKPSLRDRGLGGPASVDQSARVTNSGEADANTGGNTAVGNASRNRASNNQSAVAGG